MKKIYALILCFAMAAPAFALSASAGPAPQAATQPSALDTPAPTWTLDQAVTCSVSEAWALGGRTEQGFFAIVRALAELSAQKRDVALPDRTDVGRKFGLYIKTQAKADHDQLLYAIVDHAVRMYGARSTAAAAK